MIPHEKIRCVPDGDVVIEGLDFAGGHTGNLLTGGSNIRVENCRIELNAYVGAEFGWHQNYYKSIMENEQYKGYRLFGFRGSNHQVLNCEIRTSQWMQFVGTNGAMEYTCVANNTFEHTGPTGMGVSLDGMFCAIFEDNAIDETGLTCKDDNVYVARTTIEDMTNTENRETMTTDVGAGLQKFQQGLDIGADGVTFTFPEAFSNIEAVMTDATARKYRMKLIILDGTGEGQWRYITGYNGRSVTVAAPFTVAPDETSRFSVNVMYTNWYFVDCTVDNGGMFQYYMAQANSVIDGMKITRSAGIKLYGQQSYGVVGNNWYCSVVNCQLSDGNYFHRNGYMDYWVGNSVSPVGASQRIPGGSFIAAVGTPPGNQPTYNLCCTIRGNTLTNNCLIYIFSVKAPVMEDCIVDSNYSYDTRCGIYIEGTPGRILLNNNTTDNVPSPVEYFPYDGDKAKPQFE